MWRGLYLFILFFFTCGFSTAQDVINPVVQFSHPVVDRINAMVDAKRYKGAIELALATADQMKQQSNWEGYIAFIIRAAEIETFEVWKTKGLPTRELDPDYTRPRKYLETLNRNAGKVIDEYPYLKAKSLYTGAVVYGWLDMPDTAQVLHDQALELRKVVFGKSSREVADSYLWRGRNYNWGLQRKDLAEPDFRRALVLQKKFMPDSRYALGSVYYGLANIARDNFQFDEALALTEQYMSVYQDIPYEQAFGLQLIANVCWSQKNFEKALEYRKRAIAIYEKSGFKKDLILEYSNFSNDLVALGRFKEAESALKKGEQILNSDIPNLYYAKMLYQNFAELYRLMKKYDISEQYYGKALDIAVKQYGARNDKVADVYRMRGVLYLDQKRFESGLQDYQKMLHAVIPDFSASDYHGIQDIQHETPYFRNIIGATFYKGDAFLAWFRHSGEIPHLESALDNYRQAYKQIIVARQRIGDELSKPFLMSMFHESIDNSMVCAHLLYRKTGDEKFIQDALYFVELTKYLNVLDALKRAERTATSGVRVELLLQLKNTVNEIRRLQMIHMQPEHFKVTDDSVAHLRDRILDLIDTRRELNSEIAKYSAYSVFSPDSMIVNVPDIQNQLGEDQQVLEFFWGKDSIYTISLTSESATLASTIRTPDLDQQLKSLQRMLEDQPAYTTDVVQNYSSAASQVYNKLFRSLVDRKKLIIIPDGELNLIPVEALVITHQAEKNSFRNLDYLIHTNEISYAYSSSILFHDRANNHDQISNVLAFSYSVNEKENNGVRQDHLSSIPGTYKELEALSQVFNNVSRFTGDDARKANFIAHVRDHDLIHLGVHGVGDTEIVDNSRLVFRSDSLESGELYAFDIYNLDINAKLVVLSACETGMGKRQSGEGVFSIARAFSYAGCPSVVMSMWRARDTFTASIMGEFYQGLSKGYTIGESLRASKLKFLGNSDELSAHPANWAAFVLNGQDQSFSGRTIPVAVWLVITATGVALIYWAARKKIIARRR